MEARIAQAQLAQMPSIGRTRTPAIDVGGTHLKASVVDEAGRLLVEPVRIETPVGSPPRVVIETLARLAAPLGEFDRASVGFPGVVRNGRVLTAPNLDHGGWTGFDLDTPLSRRLG
jgi:polyphosphate glucokinase